MNFLISFLTRFTPLSIDSQQALLAISHRQTLKKGHVLIKADMVADSIYVVEKGLARTYYYKDGRDVTDWLSAENQVVGSVVSFLTQKPDPRIVQLLEPSVVWAVPHRALEELYRRHHDIERLGRLLVSHGLVLMQHRFDDLHMATALERYERLITTMPTLIQRVPMGMLASYLGIAPETLSRVRAQV